MAHAVTDAVPMTVTVEIAGAILGIISFRRILNVAGMAMKICK